MQSNLRLRLGFLAALSLAAIAATSTLGCMTEVSIGVQPPEPTSGDTDAGATPTDTGSETPGRTDSGIDADADVVDTSPPPIACGGSTGVTCPDGAYCARAVGACDATGTCTAKPPSCGEVLDPVCGCDGKDYDNECEAARAGVAIAKKGTCGPKACGGLGALPCAADEYCAYTLADACGFADASAYCVARPLGCTKEIDPVCGCDGTTYTNECEANRSGFAIRVKGACGG